MDRCPNCGSATRAGARFCTACGFRLPEQQPAANEPARSPFATTSTYSGQWSSTNWNQPAPPPVPVDAAETATAATEPTPEPDAVPIEVEATVPDQTVSVNEASPDSEIGGQPQNAGWQTAAASQPADAWAEIHAATAPPPASAGRGAGEAGMHDTEALAETIAGWEGSHPPVPSNGATGGAVSAAVEEVVAPEAAVEPAGSTATAARVAAEPDELETVEPVIDSVESNEVVAPEPIAAETRVTVAEPETSGTGSVQHALALVDELRSLVATFDPAAGIQTPSAISNELAAAKAILSGDPARFDDLRALVATAQSRPRDIDVMLTFVSKADQVAELLSAHDALAEILDRVIEQLEPPR